MSQPYSAIIIGGGMIGLTLAQSLAKQSLRVALVDSHQPNTEWDPSSLTAEVFALNLSVCNILHNIGLEALFTSSAASMFCNLNVWNHQNNSKIEFKASEIKQNHLGYIVEKRAIISHLWQQLIANPLVDLFTPQQPKSLNTLPDQAELTLNDGLTICAKLVIGADGPHSWVRNHLNIPTYTRAYNHDAIISVIETTKPHNQSAWQPFTKRGPLGILPLNQPHRSSMVWSMSPKDANHYCQLPIKNQNLKLTNALQPYLGDTQLLAPCTRIPLVMRHVKAYYSDRVAIIGDAAHTIHPLAGQGANLGFCDAAILADSIKQATLANKDIGSQEVLKQFQSSRKKYNTTMMNMMRLLKDTFTKPSLPLSQLTGLGFNTLNKIPAIKSKIIRYATQPDAGSLSKPPSNH